MAKIPEHKKSQTIMQIQGYVFLYPCGVYVPVYVPVYVAVKYPAKELGVRVYGLLGVTHHVSQGLWSPWCC